MRSAIVHVCALAALALGCARQHPEANVSDTATNWLSSCMSDADCSAGSCLRGRCTLACSERSAAVCGQIASGAICDGEASACDMPCEATAACEPLGPGYTCRVGRCRMQVASGIRSSEAVPLSVPDRDAAPPEWSDVAIREQAAPLFDRSERFQLSDEATKAELPFVTWEGDHWRVVWGVDRFDTPATRFGLADVYPTGSIEARQLEIATPNIISTVKGDGSRIAHLGSASDGSCTFSVTDLDTFESSSPWLFACAGTPSAAPVPGSDDWLLNWWVDGSFPDAQQAVVVARRDPGALGWATAPRLVSGYPFNSGSEVIAVDGDAWALVSNYSLHRVFGIAEPEPIAAAAIPHVETLDLDRQEAVTHLVVPVRDGVLLLRTRPSELHVLPIHADGSVAQPQVGAWMDEVRGGPQVTRVPELGLLALCGTGSEGLWLALMDEQGRRVGESIALDSDGHTVMSCDLAWSGSELLVAWGTFEGDHGFIPPGFPGDGPFAYRVEARIVPLPFAAE